MVSSSTTYLFLDESGDHSLYKIDPQYPLFVLGGALITKKDHQIAKDQWSQMKKQLFGRARLDQSFLSNIGGLYRRRRNFFQLVNNLGMGFGQIQKKQYPKQALVNLLFYFPQFRTDPVVTQHIVLTCTCTPLVPLRLHECRASRSITTGNTT